MTDGDDKAVDVIDDGVIDIDYEDVRLAAMYDVCNPWGRSDAFYLELVMAAGSVLDVGCGTGTLLCRARAEGHTGDLVGVDPATGMLAAARAKHGGVEFVRAGAGSMNIGRTFELVTMTGHAFQVLLDDEAVRSALANFHRHLAPGGLLAFETRNPGAREWEGWTLEATRSLVRSPEGDDYEAHVQFTRLGDPDLVVFGGAFRNVATDEAYPSESTLRFVDPEHLRALVTGAGFEIEGWYGYWDRSPVTDTSPEIIVLARKPVAGA